MFYGNFASSTSRHRSDGAATGTDRLDTVHNVQPQAARPITSQDHET